MKNLDWNKLLSSHFASAVLVFVAAFLFLRISENQLRRHGHDGMYFQNWTSERMMQTVAIEDLRDEPFKTLWYLHVHPPLLDATRAAAAAFFPDAKGKELVKKVDSVLYVLWNIAYAFMGALVYLWIVRMTTRGIGYLAAFLFVLHPAMVFYATLLETTILSAFAVLWLYFELWKLGQGDGRGFGLSAALVFGFFTRSVFQWPALIVLLAALVLMRVPWRKVAVFAAVAGIVIVSFTAKQYVMFGEPYTSTFAGYNFCRSIGGCPNLSGEELEEAKAFLEHHPPADAAKVLSRPKTLESRNYNALVYLERHKKQEIAFKKALAEKDPSDLFDEYIKNLKIYFKPSSKYTKNVIVDRLPWRDAYDYVFSGWWLAGLLAFSMAVWIARHRKLKELVWGAGLILPVLYVFAVSVLFERGENHRFKFFVEPVLFVFIVTQLASVGFWFRDGVVAPHLRRQWEKAQVKPKEKEATTGSHSGRSFAI